MSATVRQAGIRLSLQGAQEVTRGLREIGDAGERNLSRVTQEAGAAASALRLLGPILGGLGAGLGLGSLVTMAQNWVTDMAVNMLGLRDNTQEAERAAEAMMSALRDEGRAVQTNISSIGDLLKTAAERAADLARAQRESLRLANELRMSTAIQMQDAAAAELPAAERELQRIRDRLAAAQAEQALARRARGPVPADEVAGANSALFSATARVEGLRAELALQGQRIAELATARDQLAGLPPVTVGESGRPSARAAGGGGRVAAPRDTTDRDAARAEQERLRIVNDLNAYNQAINLQNAGLTAAGPVLDAYSREMDRLNQFLAAGVMGQDDFSERVRLASEALAGQMEQAERAGQAVSGLSRETSRFATTAASDFAKAVLAGKSLGDTISNITSRLGSLFLDRAFGTLFGGGGKGGGFDLFGAVVGALGFGARANGGPVEPGRPYLVGERGPELFVPNRAGAVAPNSTGGGTVINQSFDFRGATVDEVKFRRIADESARRAVAGLAESRRESRAVLA